ncbi:macrophage-capping protein isoform X2 [Protopterus annectens]|nr:macrophage-capping protein isoform X2 [Protopterus annectens]
MPSLFDNSASQPGLHIWRIEKLRPIRMSDNNGEFFSGDAYLVLRNEEDGESHLHIWLGEKSSKDEQGAGALLATQLDDFLGGRPVQHRETQGNESELFMSYFPKGVKYKEGGVDSGFQKVQTGPAKIQKLYQVKGKKNIRATEVSLKWSNFNRGDCFLLDLGETIIGWSGSQSNMFERQKLTEIANGIRDCERKGKSKVQIVVEGEEPEEMIQILGPKPQLADGNPEDDTKADVKHAKAVGLYKISDATGAMRLTVVSESSPFDRKLLVTDDCFILDNGKYGKIYIWKGNKANEEEKKAALLVADKFIKEMNYKPNTQVEILPEGRETVLFKQFFKTW